MNLISNGYFNVIFLCLVVKVIEFLEILKDKFNDFLSNFSFRLFSFFCDCECYYDSCGGSLDGEGCDGCYEYYEDFYGYGRSWDMFGGWGRYVYYKYYSF